MLLTSDPVLESPRRCMEPVRDVSLGKGEAASQLHLPDLLRGEGRKERTLASTAQLLPARLLLPLASAGVASLREHLLPSKPMGSPLPVGGLSCPPQIDRRAAMMGSSFL